MLVNSSSNLWAIIDLSPPKSGSLCGYKKLYIPYRNLICNISLSNIKCSSNVGSRIGNIVCCNARRRVRYEDDSYGYNEELALLEMYTQSATGEALIVTAMVDDQQAQVLIFKGFSSCLSYKTSPDPSTSVLPKRAIIKLIDRIKGPFDPNNIDYIEKGLTFEAFTTRIAPTNQ